MTLAGVQCFGVSTGISWKMSVKVPLTSLRCPFGAGSGIIRAVLRGITTMSYQIQGAFNFDYMNMLHINIELNYINSQYRLSILINNEVLSCVKKSLPIPSLHSSLMHSFLLLNASTSENKTTCTKSISQKEKKLFCYYMKEMLKIPKKIWTGYLNSQIRSAIRI